MLHDTIILAKIVSDTFSMQTLQHPLQGGYTLGPLGIGCCSCASWTTFPGQAWNTNETQMLWH